MAVAVISACLTLNGNESLKSLFCDGMKRLASQAALPAHALFDIVEGRFTKPPADERPGATYALIVSDEGVVGIDRNGCVAGTHVSFTGHLPSLTGFAPHADSVGEILSAAEVVLGLCVIRSFEQHPDLAGMVSEVNLRHLGNPRAVLCGGLVVDIGAGAYIKKIDRLHQVLLQAEYLGIRPTRVDLRFGRQVVVEYESLASEVRKEV
jgi:hypothetical protein